MIWLDVHDFAEDVRMHGEKRAEDESLPRQLRNAIEPTAENEDEEIAGLDEDVEGRAAFESDGASVVEINGEENCGEPENDARAGVNPENAEERNLPDGDLPAQGAQLLIGAARTEHVSAFAGIVAVAFGVDDVVDAIKEKAEGKNDVEKSDPKTGLVPIEKFAQGHQIEKDCSGPKAGPRNLNEKFEVGKKTRFCMG